MLEAYPFTCLGDKFVPLNLLNNLAKNVNFQGSGSVIFSVFMQISILRKFSSISIPEIAKTNFAVFEKSLTAAKFFDNFCNNYWRKLKKFLIYLICNIFIWY